MNTIIQQWNNQEKTEKLGVSPEDIKPNAAVLFYGAVKNSKSAERRCLCSTDVWRNCGRKSSSIGSGRLY